MENEEVGVFKDKAYPFWFDNGKDPKQYKGITRGTLIKVQFGKNSDCFNDIFTENWKHSTITTIRIEKQAMYIQASKKRPMWASW